jgi:hypothetical protein|nr:MAG TPA: hypothetical protein [Caudoviricetes sp.]
MEQKDIDIYEILKDVPTGTVLYTPLSGKVVLSYLATNKEAGEGIWTENKDGEYSFNKNGRWMEGGEVLLFPSKEMRDWSKFFKKGDVLVSNDSDSHIIFNGFSKNDYTTFEGKHWISVSKKRHVSCLNMQNVQDYHIEDNKDSAQTYINAIEKFCCGKLNRETQEIEKPVKFEVGKLYVFREEDEDGELTIIGKLIDKNESEDTLTFGNQYEIENEKFVTNQTFDLRISVNKELREATDGECYTFQEAYDLWEKSKEHPVFKPFDKVLARVGSGFKWFPALFIRDRGESFTNRYNVLPLHTGKPADFFSCIPFEGHENFAFTDYDFVDLPF